MDVGKDKGRRGKVKQNGTTGEKDFAGKGKANPDGGKLNRAFGEEEGEGGQSETLQPNQKPDVQIKRIGIVNSIDQKRLLAAKKDFSRTQKLA